MKRKKRRKVANKIWTLQLLLKKFVDEFETQYKHLGGGESILVEGRYAVGDWHDEYDCCFQQYSVSCRFTMIDSADLIGETILSTWPNVLARLCIEKNVSVFAELPPVSGSDESMVIRNPRTAIRAIRRYDFVRDEHILRFDVLGGSV